MADREAMVVLEVTMVAGAMAGASGVPQAAEALGVWAGAYVEEQPEVAADTVAVRVAGWKGMKEGAKAVGLATAAVAAAAREAVVVGGGVETVVVVVEMPVVVALARLGVVAKEAVATMGGSRGTVELVEMAVAAGGDAAQEHQFAACAGKVKGISAP